MCLGSCPHPLTVYNRGRIKGYIQVYYEYYPTVNEGGYGLFSKLWALFVMQYITAPNIYENGILILGATHMLGPAPIH